jgi:hypothetical protein
MFDCKGLRGTQRRNDPSRVGFPTVLQVASNENGLMRNIFSPIMAIAILLAFVSSAVSQAADLTKVDGVYLQLITDEPLSDEVRGYVRLFDEAVPLWLSYFKQEPQSLAGWRMTGYLMRDKASFQQQRLIPGSLPNFPNGYSSGNKLWVVKQPSAYYTTHLLLHEGVHGITEKLYGGSGPPWYMEGIAEFLATHNASSGSLKVGVIPPSREESPFWGRLGLIADRSREGKVPTIESVLRYSETAHRDVEPYAWSWAAAVLMEMHPEYHATFREAIKNGSDSSPQFTRELYQALKAEWPILAARWSLLCHDFDYGFDRERNCVALKMNLPPASSETIRISVESNQSWHAAPGMVKAGQRFEVKASGMFQLQDDPRWKSTAEGVTITYYRGLPLGRLIACVVPEVATDQRYLPKLECISVGGTSQFTVQASGWLLFKVNDAPNDLSDNQGQLSVEVRRI